MAAGRKFAVFDIDGTLIRWQLYHAVVDSFVKLGYITPHDFLKIEDARMSWKRRESSESFKDYERLLVDLYRQAITNITTAQFKSAVIDVFDEYKDQVYVYSRDLIASLKKDGYTLFAISGSQDEIVSKIADYYGFDDYVGVKYLTKGNKFTGEAILTVGRKDEIVKDLAKKHNIGFIDSVAVGDSGGDIDMLELVENPIAFNPERKLFQIARQSGWKVVIERKNMIYELEATDGRYELVKTSA